MEKVIIFGIGDISQIAHLYLSEDTSYEVVAFTMDKEYIKEDTFLGLPVVAFENLEDEKFVEYINEIIKDFPEYDFKALYFDKNSIKEIKNKFQHSNLNLIELKSAKDIFENLEVYLSNYEKTFKDRFEMPIMNLLRYKSNDIALLPLGLNKDKYLTLREFENQNKVYFKKLLDNLEYLGFNKSNCLIIAAGLKSQILLTACTNFLLSTFAAVSFDDTFDSNISISNHDQSSTRRTDHQLEIGTRYERRPKRFLESSH